MQVLKGICEDGSKTTSARTLVHGDFKAANVLFSDSEAGAARACVAEHVPACCGRAAVSWQQLHALLPLTHALTECLPITARLLDMLHHRAGGQPLTCAVYDFQYCGEGLGLRDVAYMLCSSVDEDVLEQHEPQLLQHYHATLCAHLARHGKQEAAERYTLAAAQAQLDIAIADFVRFMAGWRGGSWGASGWANARTRRVLQQLPSLMRAARAGW